MTERDPDEFGRRGRLAGALRYALFILLMTLRPLFRGFCRVVGAAMFVPGIFIGFLFYFYPEPNLPWWGFILMSACGFGFLMLADGYDRLILRLQPEGYDMILFS
jgi:hypothetical protein